MGDVGDMSIHECGTCWRSLSVIVDGIFSIVESVWRLDDGVGNGKNDDPERNLFSFKFVVVDRDYSKILFRI